MLQCIAVCCSVLQCIEVLCSVLQCVAVLCSVLQPSAMAHDSHTFHDSCLMCRGLPSHELQSPPSPTTQRLQDAQTCTHSPNCTETGIHSPNTQIPIYTHRLHRDSETLAKYTKTRKHRPTTQRHVNTRVKYAETCVNSPTTQRCVYTHNYTKTCIHSRKLQSPVIFPHEFVALRDGVHNHPFQPPALEIFGNARIQADVGL